MSNQQKILGDISIYSASLLLTQVVTVISSIVMRRFLGPVQVGVWSLVQVVLVYADYSSLGIMNAAAREIPFFNGKGDTKKADEIKDAVFSFSFISSLLIAAGVSGYAVIFRAKLGEEFFFGLLIASGLLILQRINALLIVFLRAYKEFSLAGRQMIYSALLNAFLVALLSFRYKLYGFMIAMALSLVFNIVYILKNRLFSFRLRLGLEDLKPLIVYGFPLFLIALFGTFFETISKLMITKFISLEALGVYSIALMTTASIQSVPNSIAIVIVPNLHEKFGRAENKADLKGYLEKASVAYAVLLPLFIGICWFLVPLLVHRFLPAFTEGVRPLCYLALGTYFSALAGAFSQFIYVVKKHMKLLVIMALACAVTAGLIWAAIARGYGLSGVSLASTASVFIYFTMVYFYVARHVYPVGEAFVRYGAIIGRFLWLTAVLFLLERFVGFSNLWLRGIVSAGLFILAEIPFLLFLEKKLGLVTLMLRKFKLIGPESMPVVPDPEKI